MERRRYLFAYSKDGVEYDRGKKTFWANAPLFPKSRYVYCGDVAASFLLGSLWEKAMHLQLRGRERVN